MKRIIAFALCLLLVFSLSACGKDKKATIEDVASSSSEYKCDIEGSASEGKIPELEKANIGYSIDTFISENSIKDSDVYKGSDYNRITLQDSRYYYHYKNYSDGISFIAFFANAYEFTIGITKVSDVTSVLGTDVYTPNEDEMFFFYGGAPEGVQAVSKEFGDYTVTFYFQNDLLSATTIYLTSEWK